LKAAFESDPKLRRKVCDVVASASVDSGSGGPERGVAELRAAELRLCRSLALRDQQQARRDEQARRGRALLESWYRQDRDTAHALAPSERRGKEAALRLEALAMPQGQDRARAGVAMIALRPQGDFGIGFLLEHGGEALSALDSGGQIARPGVPMGLPHAVVREFVVDVYRDGASTRGDEQMAFKSGLSSVLYLTGGDLKEARELAAQVLHAPGDDNPSYQTVFVATLDRLLGDAAPLRALVTSCPFPQNDRFAGDLSDNYCRSIEFAIANRGLRARGREAPDELVEIMREVVREEPWNWPLRMTSIRAMQLKSVDSAAAEFQAVLDTPAEEVPDGARLDALQGMEACRLARNDFRGAGEMAQQWADTFGWSSRSLPADAWSRLAALAAVPEQDWTQVDKEDDLAGALASRIWYSILGRDYPTARDAIEQYLAHALDAGHPEQTRVWLDMLACAELADGDSKSARRVFEYLLPQPKNPVLADSVKTHLESLDGVDQPVAASQPPESPW
jgi:hypothetical protein